MTIHEMLQQVALFSSGAYRRSGDVSSIEIPLPAGRRQIILGRVGKVRGEAVGILSTKVGRRHPGMNIARLLSINAALRHSRIAMVEEDAIVLVGYFQLDETSIRECAPMLQEMAAVADDLERTEFGEDAE